MAELLGRLEWRSSQEAGAAEERDEAVERVLAVDVLRLLAADGPHGPEVRRRPVLRDQVLGLKVQRTLEDVLRVLAAEGPHAPEVRRPVLGF